MRHLTKEATWLRALMSIACIIGGLLADGNIYRYVIEVPAWRYLNITTWAEYSHHADLGNGLFLFPFEAIGGAIPLVVASIIIMSNESVF